MNRKEILKISFTELMANKTKSALTMLGIVFGVASVIAMLSIGEGARQETLEQLKLLGSNNIFVATQKVGNKNLRGETSFSSGLNIKDANSILKINPYIKSVVVQREAFEMTIYKSTAQKVKIVGVTENFPQVYNAKLSSGYFFSNYHENSYANVCVIGSDIKEKFFKFESAVGKEIKIGSLWFEVIGVMAKKKSSAGSGITGVRNYNEDIYIPFKTMVYKFKGKNDTGRRETGRVMIFGSTAYAGLIDRGSVDLITVNIKDDKYLKEAAKLIDRILLRRHYGIKDYKIIIPEEILEQKQKTQRIFNVVMGAIAGISLLVGGIGIMNIMLANIMERTREIGIRRAIGATRNDVLNQFIYEALIISIAGGVVGVLLGIILTSIITSYAGWKTAITLYSVVLSFFVSVGVGLGFGIYPAKKAAEKDPIESLRYE